MSSTLPSGFRTRSQYNEYMKKYNRKYRRRKKAQDKALFELLKLFPKLIRVRALLRDTPERRRMEQFVDSENFADALQFAKELVRISGCQEPEILRRLVEAQNFGVFDTPAKVTFNGHPHHGQELKVTVGKGRFKPTK